MSGLLIIFAGAVLLYAAFTKRGDAVLNALKISLPAAGQSASTGGGSGGGGGGGGSSSGDNPDSGSHQGLLPDGSVVTINKSYGDMSGDEQDAANNYARHIGNFGSG